MRASAFAAGNEICRIMHNFNKIYSSFQFMKTRLLSFWGCLCLLAMAASAPLRAQNLNLAAGRPATASSTENATYPASNATDQDYHTRWSSEFTDNQFLVVDLGSVQTVDRIRLTWEYANGRNFLLQVSNDALTWTTVRTVTGNAPPARDGYYLNEYSDLNANGKSVGRYVRLLATARNTPYGYSIYEFEVFSFSKSTASLASGMAGSASDTEQGHDPSLAFDGNDNTRWSTLNGTNQSLTVDLGQNSTISRVYLNWELAYGVNFILQSSNDGATWTTFATYNNNQALYNEMAVAASGRYVRLYGINGGQNGGGFSLWEFQLFGTAAPLPVTLTSFAAAARGAGVAINWTTASEQNNAGFEVQRGTDGIGFGSIAKVAGAGNSQIAKAYLYLDAAPLPGTSYYRLKQIDRDGRQTYGPVVAVQLAGAPEAGLTIYPNPTPDHATVQWEAAAAGAGQWRLSTTTGQVVRQQAFAVQPGLNAQHLDLSTLPAGTYVLQVEAGGQVLRRQLVQKVQ